MPADSRRRPGRTSTEGCLHLRRRHRPARTLNHGAHWTGGIRELVDIKALTEAKGISDEGNGLRIGALVTAKELAASALVKRHARALAEAAAATSAPMLRARGTVGGNLVTPHPAGDVATALLALGAVVEIAVPRGRLRRVALSDLMEEASSAASTQSLILSIRVAKCGASAFEKLAHRRALARSLVAVAVAGYGKATSVALGGLSARPFSFMADANELARSDLEAKMRSRLATNAHRQVERPELSAAAALITRALKRAT